MSSSKETIQHTLIVAFLVCLVCSVVVAGAAVALKPMQQKNKDLDRKTNVLAAAGMLEPGTDVEAAFKQFDVRIVNLETGEFVEGLSPEEVAPKVAARNEELSHPLSASEDPASIKRKPKYAAVYVLTNEDGIERLVLPVYGYGLWSTLYGYMAVSGDLNTVAGIGFYEHAETPGLGGRNHGSPREGPWAESMRATRARFKLCLRWCRAHEQQLRWQSLVAKLAAGDSREFWRAVKSTNPRTNTLPLRVDQAVGENDIATMRGSSTRAS